MPHRCLARQHLHCRSSHTTYTPVDIYAATSGGILPCLPETDHFPAPLRRDGRFIGEIGRVFGPFPISWLQLIPLTGEPSTNAYINPSTPPSKAHIYPFPYSLVYSPTMCVATAVTTVVPAPIKSEYEKAYDPTVVLNHPEFAVLPPSETSTLDDKKINLSCAYNEKHEVTMIKKPVPKAGRGECVVHVRATGICG